LTTAGTPLAPVGPRDDAAAAGPRTYRIFIRDLVLPWEIGIYDHEQDEPQRVRINVDMMVRESSNFDADRYREVVCYATVADKIRQLALRGHINLVETLASLVADMCLSDNRVERVTVRAEKLDAISDVSSVGIEIERRRGDLPEPRVRVIGDS
jgi:dihydroneopterin aldolase